LTEVQKNILLISALSPDDNHRSIIDFQAE